LNDLKNQSLAARVKFAIAGLRYAVGAERSVRTHVMILAGVVAVLVYLRPAPVWWALVLLVSSAVIAAELFNTALEGLADQLQPERKLQIRIIKDCSAAAVLVLAGGALCVAAALAVNLWSAQ
jgi:undecaprenol kinase